MTDLNTCNSLLVGNEQSKSYPGTQASNDAQGPGCPPYSGVGKDPPSLTTDRQTPASPLDLTSLAAAIPVPTPANASAWTLVAPKKKRKGKTPTTNMNTDELGYRGGKRKDSDRPTADACSLAGCGEGGSEVRLPPSGSRPLADTRAKPGCFAGDHVGGWRPGPDRDPKTSRESSTSTTGAGQSAAKDGVNEGDRIDPDGNLVRARGATGPGSSNTARPHIPTTITKTNAHNLPNSRVHPRFRKRNRGATAKNNPGTSVPSSHPNKKRVRLDDTLSPRGEHKRPRKDWHAKNTRGSYATATQSHLDVAITTTPRLDLTPTEANAIQGQIQKAIFAACLKPPAPGQASYAPAFDGKAFPSEGVLKMRCFDDRALSWLKTVVPTLKSPREGTGLTVIHQSDIITKIRSGLYVPDFDGEIGQLHQVLTLQNPWYEVSRWTLFSHQVTASSPPGIFLILGIPKEELPTILARGRKVAYSTGSIYVRFFTSEGLSDVPPGQTEAPEVREGPDVDRDMDVDRPTPPRPMTPEPSVGKVLENIEAVLTEAKADKPSSLQTKTTPNATEVTAPAEQTPAQRAHIG